MSTTRMISALTLVLATLTGCRESRAPHAVDGVQAQAAEVAEQAHAAAPAAPVAAPCAAPQKADVAEVKVEDTSKKPRARAEAAAGKLRVKRLVISEGVKDREPVEAKTTFHAPEAERIYAFVEVENGAGEETEITVSFEPEKGAPTGNVTLPVGASPRWRTWAFTRGARGAGAWAAVVRAPDGEILARAPFEITL